MTTAELYTKGSRVWIPDAEEVWRGAQLLEDYKLQKKLQIKYEDGEVTTINVPDKTKLPPLRNPEILIGENDLTSLSYLHEPAVLYNLQVRFCERNAIYTYCGIVLVAINPYEELPIYGNETIMAYSGQDMGSMDPHIYAVAEESFKKMAQFDENQSIIVSGESGAGKTVSAKYAMRYFATVGGAQTETQIEKKVLASNPIMEAIGNAKTIRNDNSSRFGKYIGIGFNQSNYIIGANMRTYLLEKSRVVFQARDERNYHIFYQLCACSEMPEFEELKLNHPDIFYYTNQGENPFIDGVDDAEEMMSTKDAFTLLGVNENRQSQIFRIMSGILHMGNIIFQENDDETCHVPKSDRHFPIMAEMLGIDADQMRHWLCNRKIVTSSEVLVKPLNISQTYFARDALSKHIYSFMFSWIVSELNKVLTSSTKQSKFIGVLDIYGFETFEVNSFEQFCINFANEKLQQQFCMHVFKLEQEEYVREEIEWSFIDFYDNQPCINLIESKLGILDLLDEECKMPRGSDKNWCQKLYDKHLKHSHFSKPRMSTSSFIIHHFADDVEYTIEGFLEKNRDTVIEEHINILKASQYELVAELFTDRDPPPPKKSGRGVTVRPAKEQAKVGQKSHKKTVGSQFRDSLTDLMATLNATTPHYVRCIKPNDDKLPFSFEPKRAVQQLRACGVLETIRISAAGYPSRWTYPEFFHRYRVLAHSREIKRKDIKKTCENILNKLIDVSRDADKYQFGKTKIFFRAGQVAYLEKLRSERLRACGAMIQKHVKGWLARRRYQKIRRTVLLVQRYGRGMLARRHALHLKRTAAATKIQSAWRGHRTRTRFLSTRCFVVKLQAFCRGVLARRRHRHILRNAKAKIIQKYARGYLIRQRYHRVMRGIVLLQSHVRRRRAKKELKRLKIEARSVEHIKTVAKGLENKIITMQQKLDERNTEIKTMREKEIHMNELKNEVEKLRVVKSSAKVAQSKNEELESIIAQLREELMREKGEKEAALSMKEKIAHESEQIINTLQKEKGEYKEEINRLNALLKTQGEEGGDVANKKVEEIRQLMLQEFDSERSHHQKLVKDHARLQQRLENLQGDMQLLSPTSAQTHKRSASNLSNISLESETSSSTAEQGGSPPGLPGLPNNEEHGRKVPPEPIDVGLLTRLQNKIKDLERERSRLQRELERKGFHRTEEMNESDIYDTIKLQELEMDNSKLKSEIQQLRQAAADLAIDGEKGKPTSKAGQELMAQFEAMLEELARRREECLQLRTLLSARSRELSQIASESYGNNPSIVNEDGELEMAYRTQKDLNRLLEDQLQQNQKKAELREKELRQQMEELKSDNDRQQKLIGQNLTLTPEARIEATMQHEITRLTSENLDLRELNDKQNDQIKKLKKALKIYAKRLKASEGHWQRGFFTKSMSIASDVAAELEKEIQADESMPAVKQIREREYMGMFEYRKEDEGLLIKSLVLELKPRMATQALPGLPSYIMFMCIRHTDYQNDDEKVRSLLTNSINGIKKIVKKRQEDIDTVTLWLANTCRLLHCLKQYSGEKSFQKENTPKQNEHCLRNFDLSEYRQILSDLAVWVYQGLIKLMESNIQPMIVAAVLEHEAIAGLSGSKPTGLRGRLSSASRPGGDRSKDYSIESLIRSFTNFLRVLNNHGVDPELVNQVFRQLFYFVCAGALNNLLLRKDMCHWSKGMQIRYNISHLEQWLRDNRLTESGATQSLEPIVQASQLLQARKTDTDVDSIVEMCSKLSTSQIIKILNLYTPVNEFEERVPISFIRKIQQKLSAREKNTQQLLMDTKLAFPVTFPFNPSSLSLETIQIPQEWNLNFLKRV